jgi:hypothetical protein
VRGVTTSKVQFPLTPTLSPMGPPMGRGRPAVPWSQSMLNTKVCVTMSCDALAADLDGGHHSVITH